MYSLCRGIYDDGWIYGLCINLCGFSLEDLVSILINVWLVFILENVVICFVNSVRFIVLGSYFDYKIMEI